jgi:hypothetical protein
MRKPCAILLCCLPLLILMFGCQDDQQVKTGDQASPRFDTWCFQYADLAHAFGVWNSRNNIDEMARLVKGGARPLSKGEILKVGVINGNGESVLVIAADQTSCWTVLGFLEKASPGSSSLQHSENISQERQTIKRLRDEIDHVMLDYLLANIKHTPTGLGIGKAVEQGDIVTARRLAKQNREAIEAGGAVAKDAESKLRALVIPETLPTAAREAYSAEIKARSQLLEHAAANYEILDMFAKTGDVKYLRLFSRIRG